MDGQLGQQMDRWVADGRMDGWMIDGWMDR